MTGAPRPAARPISRVLIVSGDFVRTGGMDAANHALASYAARHCDHVELVAHRIAPDLLAMPNVIFHRVPKPAGSYFLGAPLLDRVGRHCAARTTAMGGRVVVNGGNCIWGDINWVHYVHRAFEPPVHGGFLRRVKHRVARRAALGDELAALGRAKVVIANSERTRLDVAMKVGTPGDRVHTVYYGIDRDTFRPITPAERAQSRERFGWPTNQPIVAFIGALGDRRKGFDVLFGAWEALCATPGWDARLVVVGAGDELGDWRHRTAERGLEGRIEFLGFRPDVPVILAGCDSLVHPARYEAYGLGVHEALCRGLPAFVTASAGVAERYPSNLSRLLLPNADDVGDLRDRLLAWRGAMDTISEAVAAFASTLRNRTWDIMSAEILALAATLAEGGAAPSNGDGVRSMRSALA